MKSEITKKLDDGYDFTIELPPGWNQEKDRKYYSDWFGPEVGYDHALETLIESQATLKGTIRAAIGFLHGGINPDLLEVVDALSFSKRIELLRALVHRFPPSGNTLARFEQDIYNCVTVEAIESRILSKGLADQENGIWLYELQKLSDNLLSVEIELQQSMVCEYEKYEEYARSANSGSAHV